MHPNDIALAIMCKAPVDGACKTRLCPPLWTQEAAELSRCFIADIALAIHAVTPRGGVAVYTPQGAEAAFDGLLPQGVAMLAQRGDDLTERLVHATADLLAAGYGGVCLINADGPTLPQALLRQAVDALRQPGDRIVLAPAIDGGYCLIGLKQAHAAVFQGIAWSTSQVLAQTLARIVGLGVPFSLLPAWYDVDDLGSLQLLLHELFGGGNPLAIDGLAGGAAPHSRAYLQELLQAADASRFGFAPGAPPG
jgi:Uncharacterized protein conserved in bacteria